MHTGIHDKKGEVALSLRIAFSIHNGYVYKETAGVVYPCVTRRPYSALR